MDHRTYREDDDYPGARAFTDQELSEAEAWTRAIQVVGDTCRRESTPDGPDYCATCSGRLDDWVEWDGHTYREARLIAEISGRLLPANHAR